MGHDTSGPMHAGRIAHEYVHGIWTQLAHRMHDPARYPLHDLGFSVLPDIPQEWRWLSEAVFALMFVAFLLWSLKPLMMPTRISCVVFWTRLLMVLVACQLLRIISFSVTQLPGPAPHCRLEAPTAIRVQVSGVLRHRAQGGLKPAVKHALMRPNRVSDAAAAAFAVGAARAPAQHWWQHLVVDVGRQVVHSCGDLIFSSHMTFVLLGVLSYQHHGARRWIKSIAWCAAVALALLIIAARKHYTVDIIIAWYTVPLVYYCMNMYWDSKCAEHHSSVGLVLPAYVQAETYKAPLTAAATASTSLSSMCGVYCFYTSSRSSKAPGSGLRQCQHSLWATKEGYTSLRMTPSCDTGTC